MVKPVVTLYSREGCHLCDDAHQALERKGYAVETVDIDADPDLRALYNHEVPVLTLNGRRVSLDDLK